MLHRLCHVRRCRAGLRVLGAVALVAALTASTAAQAQLYAASRLYRVVAPGQKVKLWSYAAIDPACRSVGRVAINLVAPPRGGEVGISFGPDYPAFLPFNPRSACNHRKVPSTLLFYHASPGFSGGDSFVIEMVSPDGIAQRVRYAVTVR